MVHKFSNRRFSDIRGALDSEYRPKSVNIKDRKGSSVSFVEASTYSFIKKGKFDLLCRRRDFNRAFSYLLNYYNDYDFLIDTYNNNKLIDEAFYRCKMLGGYFSRPYFRRLIEDNWDTITTEAMYKFMRWALPTFKEKHKGLRNSHTTYFLNIYPDIFKKILMYISSEHRFIGFQSYELPFFAVLERAIEICEEDDYFDPNKACSLEFIGRMREKRFNYWK